jgi:acyl-CoA reductase-like NAD-dependent aldehyde dehydrogenase
MAPTQTDVKDYSYFAGNQWRKAGDNKFFEVHEPYSGKLFARVAAGSRADARVAVDAAAKAFEMAAKVLAGIVNVNSPTVNDEIHAPMGGVRDSGWGRTGPRSLDDFSDLIWINSHSGQRQYPY